MRLLTIVFESTIYGAWFIMLASDTGHGVIKMRSVSSQLEENGRSVAAPVW